MNNKKDYDLSELTLEQLIEVFKNINEFLKFLKEAKIKTEEKENNNE